MIDPDRRCLVLLAVLGLATCAAAQSSLLADIRPGALDRSPDSDPSGFVQVGTRTFFTATDPRHGRELWAMEAQAVAPRIVFEFRSGPEDGLQRSVRLFPVAGGVVFQPVPVAWWFSDGTPTGTFPVLEGISGPQGGVSVGPRSDGQRLWFVGYSLARGNELYVTDGTLAGTRLVSDLQPGGASGFAGLSMLVPDGRGGCWFSANDGVSGQELWFTDGTRGGSRQVVDLASGPVGSAALPVGMLGSELVFSVHVQGVVSPAMLGLWITDGTAANTRRISAVTAPFGRMVESGGKLYFAGFEPLTGTEPWVTDGTPAGTFLLVDAEPGRDTSYPDDFTAVGGQVWLVARTSGFGRELWTTDGTQAGTFMAADLVVGEDGVTGGVHRAGTALVFASLDPTDFSMDILSFDTVSRTATRLVDLPSAGLQALPLQFAVVVGAEVWFPNGDATHGRELWRTDGSVAGTRLLVDLAVTSPGSNPQPMLVDSGLRAWFLADDGVHGREPWITDGTPAGTRLWADLVPGPAGSDPATLVDGDRIYWVIPGELFSTDLLGGDRQTLSRAGPFGRELGRVGDRLFFSKPGEVWALDLASRATTRVASFSDPEFVVQPWGFVTTETDLYFLAADAASGRSGLWITDGTSSGTLLALPVWRGSLEDRESLAMAAVGPQRLLVLAAPEFLGRSELVALDRAAPTRLLQFASLPGRVEFEVSGDRAWFGASEPGWPSQLWVSDGTRSGTSRITDIPRTGFPPAGIDEITRAGDLLFFTTSDPTHGEELWVTDGSSAGTRLCRDIGPGLTSGAPRGVRALGEASAVAFAASDPHGTELWVSDGTLQGTRRLVDVDPAGGASGAVSTAGVVGSSLVFHGEDMLAGREPRWVGLPAAGGFVGRNYGAGCAGAGGAPPPRLGVVGDPVVGAAAFALDLRGAPSRAASALLVTASPAPARVGACHLWALGAAINVPRFTSGAGTARVALPIPVDSALAGLLLHAQWLGAEPGGSLLGAASATDALLLVVGV